MFGVVYLFRVKELKEELEAIRNRLNVAERSAASMEAQRKATQADKAALLRQVLTELMY